MSSVSFVSESLEAALNSDTNQKTLSVRGRRLTSEGGGASSLLLAFINVIDSILANGWDSFSHSCLPGTILKCQQPIRKLKKNPTNRIKSTIG